MKFENQNHFIQVANQIHNFKYDYSKVNYINTKHKINIICPIHGESLQYPNNHINGCGCPKCARENSAKKHKMTTEQFIEKAREIHGNKYDYSKTIYGKNNRDSVEIICPIHGSFWQTPVHHINNKCGCPKCNRSHGETFLADYFDNNNIKYEENFIVSVPIEIRPTGIIKIDFYLPEYNTFVEYNGKQHYIMQKGFGGQLKFDKQVIRDEYLRKYCKENNINLIEIPYTEKDIKKFLEENLVK